MGVEYVDNTRVLEQWYPLILVLSIFSILVYNWCLSFLRLLHFCETEIYTYGFVFFYEGNKRVFMRWCWSGALLYTWVHCSCLFDAWAIDSSGQRHSEWNTWCAVHDYSCSIIKTLLLHAAGPVNGLSVFLYLIPVKVVTALILRLSESTRCDREFLAKYFSGSNLGEVINGKRRQELSHSSWNP